MRDDTSTALIHGFVAATLAALPEDESKRFEIYNNAKQFARDYLDGKEVDGYLLSDIVESTVALIKEEIEDRTNATKQGFPNVG